MRGRKELIIVVITMILINSLSGCRLVRLPYMDTAQYDESQDIKSEDIKESEAVAEEPVYGGSITIPMVREDNLMPLTSSSKDVINVCGLIYEGLVELDDELKPAPALAESWSISEDGRVWTFKLRQGVKWHDGVEFSVEDVLFTIDILRSGGHDTYYAKKFNRLDCIENIKATGTDAFYVQLTHPVSFFLDSFTFPIIPKHIFGKLGQVAEKSSTKESEKGTKEDQREDRQTKDADNEENFKKSQYIRESRLAPVGTGPYKVNTETFNLDESFTLEPNDSYWDDKPYIDEIQVKVYGKSTDIINAFQAREIDILDTSVIFADTYASSDDVVLYRYLTQDYEFLAINHTNPALNDTYVRKALAYGIDRKSIIKEIYLNNAEAVDAPICPRSWIFDGSTRIYDCDIDTAKDLLEKADWRDTDGDGIRDKIIDGKKTDLVFTLVTNVENDLRRDVAENIRLQLTDVKNRLGIQIDIELLPWDEILEETIPKRNFDLLLTGYHMPEMPDLGFVFGSQSDGNFIGYESAELDELMLRSIHGYDDESIKDAYATIQRYFVEQLPVISLYFPTNSVIISENIQGKVCPRELNIYRDIEKWYVIDKK